MHIGKLCMHAIQIVIVIVKIQLNYWFVFKNRIMWDYWIYDKYTSKWFSPNIFQKVPINIYIKDLQLNNGSSPARRVHKLQINRFDLKEAT